MSASEASALFDVVGEGAPVGLALVDVDLRFVRINEALAAINGRPLSIVTVDEHAVPVSHAMLSRVPSKPPVASVRHIGVPVRQLVQDRSRGVEAVVREARRARDEDGAEAVYLGSMTLGTLGVDDRLRSELGVTVFNPLKIAATTALQLIQARIGTGRSMEVPA